MSDTDDLAPLLRQGDQGGLRFGQGTIVSWDPETFQNQVRWRDVVLENLPVLGGTDALSYFEGDIVGLLGWTPGSRKGAGSWWILGRLIIPGGTEDPEVIHSSLSALVMNAGQLNADQIFLDGQDLSSLLTAGGVTDPEDPDPPTGTVTTVYNATWSQAYKGDNSINDFDRTPKQGYWSGTNGNQRSLIGFPTSTIQSDLVGRTVTRVRVYLYYDHWYFNSGGTAILGHHSHTSAPGSFSATTDVVRSSSWPKPGGRWVTYDATMSQWASGVKAGIAIGPGPSTSALYYGSARGWNESKRPRLEIRSTA